jgi:hypothetical protein
MKKYAFIVFLIAKLLPAWAVAQSPLELREIFGKPQ